MEIDKEELIRKLETWVDSIEGYEYSYNVSIYTKEEIEKYIKELNEKK